MTRRRLKGILAVLVILIAVVGVIAAYVYLDLARIGCQSGAESLVPASETGFRISQTEQLGACFATKVTFGDDGADQIQIYCRQDMTFESCRDWYEKFSSAWWDYWGRTCPTLSFIGGAACDCTSTGEGCRQEPWEVQVLE